MKRYRTCALIISLLSIQFFISSFELHAQAFQGYTLYSPDNSKYSYIVDMNNKVYHSWSHTKSGGYSCYLLSDGSLLRSALSTNSQLGGGGEAGVVQRVAWNGTLLWEYQYSSSTYRSHHDIEPMPNGNVLLIAWEVKTAAQATQAGSSRSASIWPDHIVEIQPSGTTGGNIVWQWHAWDHLIQSYSSAKDNYGVVADHPELLNINMSGGGMSGDWMHLNSIKYNATLDQIVLSSHYLNEVYVIDHSTTTAQAASHAGGKYGKGGDILYRWGQPSNYGASGSQVFDVVHCATWIGSGLPGEGHIMAFNNREKQSTSMVVELIPPSDGAGNYTLTKGTAYGPASPTWSYTASGFYANHLGSCQRLPNGNTLIAESTSGYLFETDSTGKTVWSFTPGGEVARTIRYAPTYSGLQLTSVSDDKTGSLPQSVIILRNYPNPFNAETVINFSVPRTGWVGLKVYNSLGQVIQVLYDDNATAGKDYSVRFNAGSLASGVYFYTLQTADKIVTKQMIALK